MIKPKEQIVGELRESFDLLCNASSSVPDELYNVSKENKWSTAENIEHLATSAKMTSLAFTLPKLVHVLLYGKPGRTSHGYSKVVDNYEKKLEGGVVATGIYMPKRSDRSKAQLTNKLRSEGEKLTTALNNKWTDEQLDKYVVKHPILKLITVRELAYFTIYHNQHHLETIRKYYL